MTSKSSAAPGPTLPLNGVLRPRGSSSSTSAASPGSNMRRRLTWKDDSVPDESQGGVRTSSSTSSRNNRTDGGINVHDHRSTPSPADHGRIKRSFSQGLAGVDTVMIYDCGCSDSEDERDSHRVGVLRKFFRRLGACCSRGCLAAPRRARELGGPSRVMFSSIPRPV
eukprot:TRINITY_DN12717_c0_g1_i1.p1 TRINITY_DN12717_c0_g1~~TRINITY_DN12717_c0_g1_i1.p1  ORF type:complete len:167 (-),score=10.19 TRINITY_DN12717_c0_g1_i1:227-727(-)